MTEEEMKPKTKIVPVHGNWWNKNQVTKKVKVSADPEPPTFDELPPTGFERNELSVEKPPILKRRGVGNYNADKTEPKD